LDLILCNRLGKNRNENKFKYLYESYMRLENHLVAKMPKCKDRVLEMKKITVRYFVSCLSCPDTFELVNDTTTE
jgi:hypothetical protein